MIKSFCDKCEAEIKNGDCYEIYRPDRNLEIFTICPLCMCEVDNWYKKLIDTIEETKKVILRDNLLEK